MKFYYFFINSLFGDYCCFTNWTGWDRSSLTCGQVCSKRKRTVVSAGNVILGRYAYCNSNHSPCPPQTDWHRNCEQIDCRKFVLTLLKPFFDRILKNKSYNQILRALRISILRAHSLKKDYRVYQENRHLVLKNKGRQNQLTRLRLLNLCLGKFGYSIRRLVI